MSITDAVFHNIYLLQELFSCAEPERRYCDLTSADDGDSIAAEGLLKLLQLKAANEDDLIFTAEAMDLAAATGHLPVVIYLHEHQNEGCTDWAMRWAAMNNHLDVVKWLYTNRSENCVKKAMMMVINHRDRSSETLEWFLQLDNKEVDKGIVASIVCGHISADIAKRLRYARSRFKSAR